MNKCLARFPPTRVKSTHIPDPRSTNSTLDYPSALHNNIPPLSNNKYPTPLLRTPPSPFFPPYPPTKQKQSYKIQTYHLSSPLLHSLSFILFGFLSRRPVPSSFTCRISPLSTRQTPPSLPFSSLTTPFFSFPCPYLFRLSWPCPPYPSLATPSLALPSHASSWPSSKTHHLNSYSHPHQRM